MKSEQHINYANVYVFSYQDFVCAVMSYGFVPAQRLAANTIPDVENVEDITYIGASSPFKYDYDFELPYVTLLEDVKRGETY